MSLSRWVRLNAISTAIWVWGRAETDRGLVMALRFLRPGYGGHLSPANGTRQLLGFKDAAFAPGAQAICPPARSGRRPPAAGSAPRRAGPRQARRRGPAATEGRARRRLPAARRRQR